MKRKNILFSTTRQWNPGDEFVLQGVLRLLRSVNADFNPIIFNRNPEIYRCDSRHHFFLQIDVSRLRAKRLKTGRYDNSFKDQFLDNRFIDFAVFAGTPDWQSARLQSMYEYIDRHSIPTVYLGIGAGSENFDWRDLDPLRRRVFEKARVLVVRNSLTKNVLAPFQPIHLPCPSLLAAPESLEKKIECVHRVALVYTTPKTVKGNRISQEAYRFMMEFYSELLKKYSGKFNFEFVCHYIDGMIECSKDFPQHRCNYSYASEDYMDIYGQFDLVIGPRVHAIGLSASLGIPGICLQHDHRGNTVEGFGAASVTAHSSIKDALGVFERLEKEIKIVNQKILKWKKEVFEKYVGLLTPLWPDLGAGGTG